MFWDVAFLKTQQVGQNKPTKKHSHFLLSRKVESTDKADEGKHLASTLCGQGQHHGE